MDKVDRLRLVIEIKLRSESSEQGLDDYGVQSIIGVSMAESVQTSDQGKKTLLSQRILRGKKNQKKGMFRYS